MTMSKKEAIEWAGGPTELARRLKISHAAVSRWPDKKPIPKLREYEIRDLMRVQAVAPEEEGA